MPVRTIIQPDNPVLRQKARKVKSFGPALSTLIDDMVETMRAAPGVGLAAPQVGVSQRVIVVELKEDPDQENPTPHQGKLFALVNPEIIKASAERATGTEACLSIPGFFGEVERSLEVTVRGLNRQGKPMRVRARGWLARIFQHEIDHLDGVLFVDRATKVWRESEQAEGTREVVAT